MTSPRWLIAVLVLAGCKRASPALACPDGAHQVGDATAGTAWCEKPGPSGPVRHGPYFLWQGGIAVQEGAYADGQQVGRWISRFPTGAPMEDGAYAAGQKDGIWKRFGEDGRLVQEDHFRAGKLHGLRRYRPTPDHEDVECYADGAVVWKGGDGSAQRPCPP